MNPNQSQVLPIPSVWMNIDQMLQNLSTQPVSSESQILSKQEIEQNSESNSLVSNFSIESLTKPTSPNILETQPITSNKIYFSHSFKTLASVVSTFLLIVIWWFVFSQQYPLETESILNKLFGVVNSVATTTEKNLQQNSIIVDNNLWIDTWEVHSVAPDSYVTESPLSDAIEKAQEDFGKDTTTDNMLSDVVGDDSTETWNTTIVPLSNSKEFDLPSLENSLTNNQLQEKLLLLAQSAEEAMSNLIGNSDVKMAKMRVIYKNSQALLTQLSDKTFIVDDGFRNQVTQLQSLYDTIVIQ